jgi:hypothetical protein
MDDSLRAASDGGADGLVPGPGGPAVAGEGRHQAGERGDGQAGAQRVGLVPGRAEEAQPASRLPPASWRRCCLPRVAFRLLYGLVVQDLQIRVLLGERPPGRAALAEQARTAVDRFLAMTDPQGSRAWTTPAG